MQLRQDRDAALLFLRHPLWDRHHRQGGEDPVDGIEFHGHPDAGQIKAQDTADGTVRDHLHRSAHQIAPTVGRDRDHSQRLHRRQDRQGSVLGDLQIAGDIHHRFGGNGRALGVVEINGDYIRTLTVPEPSEERA